MSSYLTDSDISRDYGHMSFGTGRYALGLLWYSCITGNPTDDVSYLPKQEDLNPELLKKAPFDEVKPDYIPIIREAIENAIASPYAITPSRYTGESGVSEDGGNITDRIAAAGGEQIE